MQELEKWKKMLDWSEKLVTYTKNLSLVELSAHISIIKSQLERDENSPTFIWILYNNLIDQALVNIAQNLQNQTHNF